MSQYKKEIAGNDKIAMIHVSRDRDDDAAEEWAAKEGFPWMTILPDDVERSGMLAYRSETFVPFYVLVDKDGNEVAKGKTSAFRQAVALTK